MQKPLLDFIGFEKCQPHQRLWKMVLIQALLDAFKENDFKYFEENNKDLAIVCSLSGDDIQSVIKRVESAKEIISSKDVATKFRTKTNRGRDSSMKKDENYFE